MTKDLYDAYVAAVRAVWTADKSKKEVDRLASLAAKPSSAAFASAKTMALREIESWPDKRTVDRNTFAFFLGVSPSTLFKDEQNPDTQFPTSAQTGEVRTPVIGGAIRVDNVSMWTMAQVRSYQKDREARKTRRAEMRPVRKVAPRKNPTRSELRAELDAMRQAQAEDRKLLRTLIRAVTTMAGAQTLELPVMSEEGGAILGFADLHSLDTEALSMAFQRGARIEWLTVHGALLRTWMDPRERQPWQEGYLDLLSRERDAVKHAERDTMRYSLEHDLRQGAQKPFETL